MATEGDDQEELKKKLVRRIGIAGVLIVVLLGGLALLEDWLLEKPAAPPPAPTAAATAQPPAEPPKGEAPPAEARLEAEKPEPPKEEPKAEPEKTEMPLAPPPVQAQRPAQRVVIKPPAAAPGPPPKQPAAAARPETAEKTAAPAQPEAKPDLATVIARSYRLQMGVFTSASNAGELHAKLEKAGIPSYVESRVHVGPFKTQKEADEARRKLKALGLGPGLLIPPQKR